MGRPPGPPDRVRRNRITITVTDGDLEQLQRLSKERKVPVGTLIYEWVRRNLRRRR